MSIFKFVKETPRTIRDMYQYITSPRKTIPACTFGINISTVDPLAEINLCRSTYPKSKQLHPYQQAIFSFDKNLIIDPLQATKICYEIGQVLSEDEYQIIGALHFDTPGKLHCHYLIHNISVYGNARGQGKALLKQRFKIDEILLKYNLSPVKR